MSDRPTRRTTASALPPEVAEAAETLRAAPTDVVQSAINKMGDAGDGIGGRQMDTSNVSNAIGRADAAEAESDASRFEALYTKVSQHGLDYLARKKVSANRTVLVPPNCDRHPRLGMWALNYCGRWMVIRWLSKQHSVRQKRFRQGWQTFEGETWATRLGLNPEFYLNEKGRIEFGDLELGWHTEEYHFRMLLRISDAQDAAVSTAKEKMLEQTDRYVTKAEILEGDDADVTAELKARRDFASNRS